MNQYTIYCTEEQTRKALKLGAPIQFETYCINGISLIVTDSSGEDVIIIPTAEQMIGWLSNQHIDCFVGKSLYTRFMSTVCEREELIFSQQCTSLKEATLAAIDAALDYLSKKGE